MKCSLVTSRSTKRMNDHSNMLCTMESCQTKQYKILLSHTITNYIAKALLSDSR